MELLITLPATAGGAGVSTANNTTEAPVRGEFVGITFTRTGTAIPVTTDVFVDEVGGANRRLLTLTNLAADPTTYYPLVQISDTSGAAVAGQYTRQYVPGYKVKVTIQQANDGTILIARLWINDFERGRIVRS